MCRVSSRLAPGKEEVMAREKARKMLGVYWREKLLPMHPIDADEVCDDEILDGEPHLRVDYQDLFPSRCVGVFCILPTKMCEACQTHHTNDLALCDESEGWED